MREWQDFYNTWRCGNLVLKILWKNARRRDFCNKIPSMKIVDMAKAMVISNLSHKIIGIRAGENFHEIMCPADDSHPTLSFNDQCNKNH